MGDVILSLTSSQKGNGSTTDYTDDTDLQKVAFAFMMGAAIHYHL
jgi:hypothetical protein